MSTDTAHVVVELTVDVSRAPSVLAALAELLGTVADLPGASVTVLDPPEVPHPRLSVEDSAALRIVPHSRVVLRRGSPIGLTRLEFDLLLYLTRQPRRVHRRTALMADVWGVTQPLGSRTVDVHIRRLRDKLGTDCALITTVRGVGYRFDGSAVIDD